MRRIAYLLFVLAITSLALSLSSAFAGTFFYEQFNYPDGNLTNLVPGTSVTGGLWLSHSGTGNPISVTAGTVTVKAQSGSAEDANRTFTATFATGSTLYASFRLTVVGTVPTSSQGDYFFHFKDGGTSNFGARTWIQSLNAAPGTYRVGVTSASGVGAVANQVQRDLATGTAQLVVVRYVIPSPSVATTVWVNPIGEADPAAASATDTASPFTVSTIALRQGSPGSNTGFFGSAIVDDIRIGTSFADVSHVTFAASNPPAPSAAQSATNVVVGKFNATVEGAVTLTAMTLQASGTGDDSPTGIPAVKLWKDLNGNGSFEVSDALVATSTYSGNNGTLTFTPTSSAVGAIPGATTTALFVTYDTGALVSTGNDFSFSVTTLTANVTATPDITGLPLSSATLTINANVSLSFSGNSVPSGLVQPGSGDRLIASVHAASVGSSVTLSALTITGSGSGNEATELVNAKLYRENSGNSTFDGGDTLLDTRTFTSGNRTVTFTPPAGLSEIGTGVSSTDLYVTYSVGGSATAGHTFALSVTGAATTGGAAITGLPLGSATLTVDVPATPTLQFGTANPSGGNVSAGSTDVVVAGFTIAVAATTGATITGLDAVASGTGDDAAAVTSVKLVSDVDASGTVSAGDVTLQSGLVYPSNNGTISFNFGGPLSVTSGSPARLLVAYSFASSVTGNSTFALTLQNAAAAGVSISGLPLASATKTVPPASLTFTRRTVAGAIVAAGTADLLVLDVTVTATNNTATLSGIRVDALSSGTGNDFTDVAAVRLFEDTNGNGIFEPSTGDTALNGAGQQFSSNNGFVTLSTGGLAMGLGASKRLFVAYSLAAGATGGGTFTPRITTITATNGVGAGLPVDGATLTIQGGSLTFSATSIPGRVVDVGAQNELIASIQATASGSAIVLVGFDVQASGTGNDATEVTSVALFRDGNANGVFEPGVDTALDRRKFLSNNGTATLSLSALTGAPVTVSAGSTATIFVALNMSTTAIPTHDFRLTIQNSLVTGGTATGLPIITSALEVRPGEVLFGAMNPASRQVPSGSTAVVVGGFSITTAGAAQSVTSFAVTASGNGNDATRVIAVKLYRDNFDGVFNSFDTLIETRVWPADDGTLVFTFSGSPQIVNPGTGVKFFLVYDFDAAGNTGSFRATITSAQVVNGRANGLPLDSATVTVLPSSLNPGANGSVGSGGGGSGGCAAVPAGGADPAAALPYAALLVGLALARGRRRLA